MKVTKMKTIILSVPIDRPMMSSNQSTCTNPVIVQLTTDEGLEGFGMCLTTKNVRVKSLKAILDDLEPVVIGQDVARINEAWQKLWVATNYMGHTGYAINALSAIDCALWVLRAKMLNLPLSTLLGGYQEKVPAYASYLLWRHWNIDQLQKGAADLMKLGFKAVKMRMGLNPFDVEVQRFKAVREVVGKDVSILIDCNWAYTKTQAIQLGRMLEGLDVFWLEDPLASDDPEQIAEVAAALDMPVTTGEGWNSKYGFRTLFEKKAADIVMIDVQQVGGVTEWIRVANMAQAQNIPVSSHLFHDISSHLVGAVSNAISCEYMPWWDKIYKDPPKVKDGFIEIPKVPGIGLEIDPAAIKKFELK